VTSLQEMLKKLNYYSEPINGDYNEETEKSFKAFCLTENFEEKLRDDGRIKKIHLSAAKYTPPVINKPPAITYRVIGSPSQK